QPVFAFEAKADFTQRIRDERVASGMQAQVAAQLYECRCTAENGSVRLTATVALTATVLQAAQKSCISGITGARNMEEQRSAITQKRRALLGSHSCRIREEVPIPAGCALLHVSGTAQIREVAPSQNGMLADGVLHLMALFTDEDGGVRAQPCNIPFTDTVSGETASYGWATVSVSHIDANILDAADGIMAVEAGIEIRVFGAVTTETPVILDAYDADGSFLCRRETVQALQYGGIHTRKLSLTETVTVPAHLPDAYLPTFARAMPAVTNVTADDSGAEIDGVLLTTFVFRCDKGLLHSFQEEIPFTVRLEQAGGALCLPQVTLCNLALSGSGRRLEAQVKMLVAGEAWQSVTQTFTAELTANPDPDTHAGILIYFADRGETLFAVGKRFGLPIGQILQLNPELREPFADGQQIVIVK
ncbi:MAG: LysM domain-containing protein, partial [Clostridiales bacterium]|nr:LysM domain-containing protein [Clostridiales bacterium]